MQAIVLYQENEFPKYQTVADPKPGVGELLVKVGYAGMNYADTMIRRGFYLQKPSFPSVLGFEYSGTVVEIGSGARPMWQGERVMGFCSGAYAEYVVISEQAAIPVPKKFSFEEAAAFPCTLSDLLCDVESLSQGCRGRSHSGPRRCGGRWDGNDPAGEEDGT